MAFQIAAVRKQILGLLNLSPRNINGVPAYVADVTGGDTIYAQGEIDRASNGAVMDVMRAICETPGHHHRSIFMQPESLDHGGVLPDHYGPIGVPRITPFSGASYTISGKVKSVEEIAAYRANPASIYSATAHNSATGAGLQSKLAGYYAIDEAAQVFYFTGFSAEADIAWFQYSDHTMIPEDYYDLAISLAIAKLHKDGNTSDVFGYHAQLAAAEMQRITSKASDQPSPAKTVGMRDSGLK